MKIEKLNAYSPADAARVRELLIQLSRSGKDRGEIPREWFEKLIASDYHDMLVARDDAGTIIGIATVSVIMGPIERKLAYLEDFVTDINVRGQGVGSALWEAILAWALSKGCHELDFTSGAGREAAWKFYQARGAEIYDTNFFKRPL